MDFYERRVPQIIRGDRMKTYKRQTGGEEEECQLEAGEGDEERGADRQARGAIIAGFMYELLIESVVTS